MLRIEVKHAAQMAAISRDLRGVKGGIRRDLTAGLRASGRPMVEQLRRNMLTMRMRGYRVRRAKTRFTAAGGPGGIRARIARLVEFRVSTSAGNPTITFGVASDRLGNARNMPRLLDSGTRFRHPVMGHRDTWASQTGQPWFRRTVIRDLDRIRREVDRALDATRRRLDRS